MQELKNYKTSDWTKISLVAAMYIALSLLLSPISFGIINFRVSEILMMLPFFNKKYSSSLIIGCLVVNLFSPMGVPDIIFGTLATCIVIIFITKIHIIWMVPIIASIVNGLVIGIELNIFLKQPLIFSILSVAFGELIVMILGVMIFNIIKKNRKLFINILE